MGVRARQTYADAGFERVDLRLRLVLVRQVLVRDKSMRGACQREIHRYQPVHRLCSGSGLAAGPALLARTCSLRWSFCRAVRRRV